MYKQIPLPISPSSEQTFDSFYCYSEVEALMSALRQFCHVDNQEFLFYLWGEQSSGVSHLLNACLNDTSSLLTQYLPLSELIDYPANAILEGMDQLDLVCIDDIDLIENNSEWQQGIFYLYNRLRDSGKKLLIGGHKAPAALQLGLKDLQSRLQWGLILALPEMKDQDKIAALQFYAERQGMELNNEVANYLLNHTERSCSALFALMKKLNQDSLAAKRKLTIPFVKGVIAGVA